METAVIQDVATLSDDEIDLSLIPQSSGVQAISRHRPAKRQQAVVVNTVPDGRELRQRVEGSCGCLCKCFIPFRTTSNFERLMNLRKTISGLGKEEQDNHA